MPEMFFFIIYTLFQIEMTPLDVNLTNMKRMEQYKSPILASKVRLRNQWKIFHFLIEK